MSSAPAPTPRPPAHLKVQPLACPGCTAFLPLGESDTARCPYCGTSVPIPETHQRLRHARHDAAANHQHLRELFDRIGKPPGVLLRTWTSVAEVVGDALGLLFALIVWAGGIFVFLSLFLLEVGAHAIAPLLGVDFADLYGGFGLYGRFAALVAFGIMLPLVLAAGYDSFATLRRQLQAALAARLPEREGGPSVCRHCGAALDVPAGAAGVTCLYCASDNLVALPPAWVARLAREVASEHHTVEAAAREEAKVRAANITDRQMALMTAVIGIPVFAIVGFLATLFDYEVSPPHYAATFIPHRHFVDDLAAIVTEEHVRIEGDDLSTGQVVHFTSGWAGDPFIGLAKGETLEITGHDASVKARVHSITTFPLAVWSTDIPSAPNSVGESQANFRAPYRGVFPLKLLSECQAGHETCSLRLVVHR